MSPPTAQSATAGSREFARPSSTCWSTTDGSRAARAGKRCQNENLNVTENEGISEGSLAATAAPHSRLPAASNGTRAKRTRGHGTAVRSASEYADHGPHFWNTDHRPDVSSGTAFTN